jgi:hypothetical protein
MEVAAAGLRWSAVSHTARMLELSPSTPPYDPRVLVRCIDACFDCAQTCASCADASLAEEDVAALTECIRLDLVCTDLCVATALALSRFATAGEGYVRTLVQACADACASCAEECERHAEHHEHCRVCAEVCRECERCCRQLLGG